MMCHPATGFIFKANNLANDLSFTPKLVLDENDSKIQNTLPIEKLLPGRTNIACQSRPRSPGEKFLHKASGGSGRRDKKYAAKCS